MTRIVWDAPGNRIFETGIDRVVLYSGNVVYPWSGVTSLKESGETGFDEVYAEGTKVGNFSKNSFYKATIRAFAPPENFVGFLGQKSLAKGLFAQNQPKPLSTMTYRTLIGNDVYGTDFAYKLHFVFDVTFTTPDRNYGTLSSNSNPDEISWEAYGVDQNVTGMRNTAHFFVDSRDANPQKLAALEDAIYGGKSVIATTPTLKSIIGALGT